MTNILFIDHASVVGGAQLVLMNYLKYLNKNKYKKVLITSGSRVELLKDYKKYSDSLYILDFPKLKRFSPFVIIDLFKLVLQILIIIYKEKISLVVTNTERGMYPGTIASFLTGRKVIWCVRDYCYSRILFSLLKWVPSKIIYVSESLINFYGVKGDKNIVVHVSSDMYLRLRKVSSRDIQRFKNDYGLKGKFVIGFIGRLARWKGIDILVKSILDLKKRNIVCLIAGVFDDKEEEFLKEIANILKYSEKGRIIFLGYRKDVALILKCLDLFVHPAREPEPYATSIIEALMTRLPVVATDLGGTSEIIFGKKTGISIDSESSKELTKVLKEVIRSKRLREKVSLAGYDMVMKENLIQMEINKLETLFEEVLGR